jgi:peptidoglycan/LPS O-acetylase OafA/YrhL
VLLHSQLQVPAIAADTPPPAMSSAAELRRAGLHIRVSRHIPAIDGLRAIAVLAVVIFHLDPHWLPGGFAGVDVFFVISGYVVASSIQAAPINANFLTFLGWFYRRRFVRILPAAIIFIVICLVFCTLFIPIAPPTKYIEATGIAALAGLSNVVLLATSEAYFSASSAFNPFTHTWSLAVEEQFYFVFPFIAYFTFVRPGATGGARCRSIWLTAIAVLVSVVLAAALTKENASLAFYMLPTRFWELGVGVLLFLFQGSERFARVAPLLTRHASAIGLTSLVILLISVAVADETAFPYPQGLFVCVATAGVIVSIILNGHHVAARFLSTKYMRFIGLISYSLYLWHWGVVVAFRWTVGLATLEQKAAAGILMFGLAVLSYYTVEKPVRFSPLISLASTRKVLVGAATLSVVAICTGALLLMAKPTIGLFAARDQQLWSPYSTPPVRDAPCAVDRSRSRVEGGDHIILRPTGCAGSTTTIFVVGDSHAGAYERMLHRLTAETGWTVEIFTKGGCKLLWRMDQKFPPGCETFRNAVTKSVTSRASPRDVLFMPGLYTPRYRDVWEEALRPLPADDSRTAGADERAAAESIRDMTAFEVFGINILIEMPKPVAKSAVFRCADSFNRSNPHCSGEAPLRSEFLQRTYRMRTFLTKVASGVNAGVWRPDELLCQGDTCASYLEDKPLFFDTDHLTGFANDLLLPRFKARVQAMLG